MTHNGSQDHFARNASPFRGPERRRRKQVLPPPYQTQDGVVQCDRRSHIDRRSAWIRDFFIDSGNTDSN